MSVIAKKKVSAITGLHIDSRSAFRDAVIFFDVVNTAPTAATGVYGLYVDSSGKLIYTAAGVDTIIGAPGAAATTWEAIFSNDTSFAMSTSTWTLTQSSDVALLTLSKSGTGAGAVIDISNSGTGADIIGTSDTWQVSKAGLAQFATNSIVGGILKLGTGSASGTLTSNGAYDLILETNSGTNSSIVTITDAANGNITCAMNGTGKFVISGTTTDNDAFQIAAGDAVITLGSLTMADNDNDAASFQLTNDTATTTGAVASLGVMNLISTSLTTGVLLNLQLTEGTLAGGYYLRAWDATGAGAVFSVGENGVITVGGDGGSNALVVTAGDVVFSDASLAITDADNAASFSVTNDTATSASVIVVAGSGVFTGSTTTSFMTVTPSGLTTGTALYVPLAAMTTGKGLHMVANALTTGLALNITSSGTIVTTGGLVELTADSATTSTGLVRLSADALTTGVGVDVTSTSIGLTTGKLAVFSHISGNITGTLNKTEQLFEVEATRTVTTGNVSDNYDLGSFIRTSVINGAGTFVAAGSVLFVENAVTNTSGTVTDTVSGIEVVMDSLGTGAGILIDQNGEGLSLNIDAESTTGDIVNIQCNTLTTGTALDMSDLSAITEGKAIHVDASGTTQTTGILVHIDSAATAITGAGRLFLSDHTGATGTSAVLNEFASAATDETVVLRVTASAALAAGVLLDLSAAALTTGTVLDMSNLDAITSGKAIHVDATGVTQTTGILVHIDSAGTAMTGAGRLLRVDHTGATTTSGICSEFASAATDETVIVKVTASAALAAGVALQLSGASVTTGSMLSMADLNALTTGYGINVVSNSADTSSRDLVHIKNDNSAAVGTNPLHIENDALISTNFKIMIELDGVTLFLSDGTTPNGNLTGAAGDICVGADSGKAYYCSGAGTTWVAL
jgi:hypothetical protein